MKKYLVPLLIALAIASMFFPWIIKYDIPYPGVEYVYYIYGYKTVCGWISVVVAVILLCLEMISISSSKGKMIVLFLRNVCCFLGVLSAVIYSLSLVLFENYDVERPYIGAFVSMVSFALLLLAFSKEKSDN